MSVFIYLYFVEVYFEGMKNTTITYKKPKSFVSITSTLLIAGLMLIGYGLSSLQPAAAHKNQRRNYKMTYNYKTTTYKPVTYKPAPKTYYTTNKKYYSQSTTYDTYDQNIRYEFYGYLEPMQVSTYQWGTHRLGGYLINPASASMRQMLKDHEHHYVRITGTLKHYDFEGGFWGITADGLDHISYPTSQTDNTYSSTSASSASASAAASTASTAGSSASAAAASSSQW